MSWVGARSHVCVSHVYSALPIGIVCLARLYLWSCVHLCHNDKWKSCCLFAALGTVLLLLLLLLPTILQTQIIRA